MIPSSEHDVRSSVSHGRVPAAVLVAVAGTWISTVVLLIAVSYTHLTLPTIYSV